MDAELTARLLACTPLTALVGNRITWGQRIQGEGLPALTMLNVSPGRGYLHSGADSLASPRVQFDCYAASSEACLALARTLTAEMEQPRVAGAIAFSVALLDAERGPLIEDVGGGAKVHRRILDFIVWFSPAG